jgi:hypothetical protein
MDDTQLQHLAVRVDRRLPPDFTNGVAEVD